MPKPKIGDLRAALEASRQALQECLELAKQRRYSEFAIETICETALAEIDNATKEDAQK